MRDVGKARQGNAAHASGKVSNTYSELNARARAYSLLLRWCVRVKNACVRARRRVIAAGTCAGSGSGSVRRPGAHGRRSGSPCATVSVCAHARKCGVRNVCAAAHTHTQRKRTHARVLMWCVCGSFCVALIAEQRAQEPFASGAERPSSAPNPQKRLLIIHARSPAAVCVCVYVCVHSAARESRWARTKCARACGKIVYSFTYISGGIIFAQATERCPAPPQNIHIIMIISRKPKADRRRTEMRSRERSISMPVCGSPKVLQKPTPRSALCSCDAGHAHTTIKQKTLSLHTLVIPYMNAAAKVDPSVGNAIHLSFVRHPERLSVSADRGKV